MISFNEQYDIFAGVLYAFKSKTDKRTLHVSHKAKKREEVQKFFPYNKFKEYTKEEFIISTLYINFTWSPSSLESALEKLETLDRKEVLKFKNTIIHYRKFMQEDVQYLKDNTDISLKAIIDSYRENKILSKVSI